MTQHHSFRFTGRTGGIQDRRQVLADGLLRAFWGTRKLVQVFQAMRRKSSLGSDSLSSQYHKLERRNLVKKRGQGGKFSRCRNQALHSAISGDVCNLLRK